MGVVRKTAHDYQNQQDVDHHPQHFIFPLSRKRDVYSAPSVVNCQTINCMMEPGRSSNASVTNTQSQVLCLGVEGVSPDQFS